RTYYEILGVEKEATSDQIREAYREIARVYHPDSNFYDEIIAEVIPTGAMDKFKEITAAYNTLVNEEKRKLYNETLPPELNSWDAQEVDHKDWVKAKVRTSGVYAMGHFGNLKEKPKETVVVEDESVMSSIGEYANMINKPWYRKCWTALVTMVYPARAHHR
ncbi:MAG: J domain-containing protein, partial [Bdellovibrionales bacterium]|nr:J domain-containing protein [Bdellovibrionales bacterium]